MIWDICFFLTIGLAMLMVTSIMLASMMGSIPRKKRVGPAYWGAYENPADDVSLRQIHIPGRQP